MSASNPRPEAAAPPSDALVATLDPTPLAGPTAGAATTDGDDPAHALTLPPRGPAETGPGRLPEEVSGYELLEELGRGGMGVVYMARQRALGRLVALKMILAGEYASPEACARFLSEAEAIARLHHPNIVQIYELGRHRDVPFFSLEYMEGGSLEKRIHGQPWSPADAARTAETLANAVQAAHDKGVIHRDLKPANILVGADGTLKITDFGLAKSIAGDGITATGSLVGTPSYMAPEQARGQVHDVGPAVDVYALGAILYELLTGRPPFRAATALDTVVQVVNQEPVAPRVLVPSVPRDLETVCLKCLHKDPAKRYASAAALAEDLRRVRAGESIRARRVPRIERAVRWARKRPAAAALVGVCAVAMVLALLGGLAHNRSLSLALEEARKQRVEADRQRASAVRNLDERFQMVDDLLFHIDTRLANLEGMSAVRLEVLDDARKLNERLLAETPGDARVLRQAGRIARGLGEVMALSDAARARRQFDRALELQQSLVVKQPGAIELQVDLMGTYARRGHLNAMANRHAEALADFQQEADLADRLAKLVPDDAEYIDWASAARFNMANARQSSGDAAAALPLFRESARLADTLVEQQPTRAHLQRQVTAAGGLASALELTAPDEARQWHKRTLTAARALARAPRGSSRALTDAYSDLEDFLHRRREHAAIASMADDYLKEFPADSNQTYNAACYYCRALSAAAAAPDLPSAERDKAADRYAGRALELLQLAFEQGFNDLVHMAVDSDLDPLRGRADYRAFFALQEKRFPSKAVTPAAVVAALKSEYEARYLQYEARQRGPTAAERRRAERDKPDYNWTAGRLLDLAEKNPDLPTAVSALAWVLEKASPNTPPAQLAKVRDRALALLRKDHLGKPAVAAACRALSTNPSPESDGVLRAIARDNPAAEAKALALYSLALSQMQQAEAARRRDPREADRLAADAERQLERVIADYGSRALDREMTADVRKKLDELRSLSEGKLAHEIAGPDLDGKPLKLSDYRGKVVLLDFWANWCGFCRQMYPGERSMVKRLAGRPFAVLGVNRDESREAALRAIRTQQLTWPSWYDGGEGRICSAWQVDAFPQMYLIDHRGVIRKKWQGRTDQEEIDTAVEELLREAESVGASR